MPSKKRRRPVSPTEEPTEEAPRPAKEPSPISLERYHLLPSELQRHIIDLACLAPASASNDAVAHFNQDLPTILNICLVSRAFKAQATFSLYRHISITRPSSLYALQQVLSKHPQRAALIRSLHIGPRGRPLPAHWWPLTYAYRPHGGLHVHEARLTNQYCEWITTSLTKDQLPSGYETLEAWPLGTHRPSGCREAAIHEALVAACSSDQLNVNLERASVGRFPSSIGTAWIPRAFEVQAALDLYLIKIRSMEEENPELVRLAKPGARIPMRCRNGGCDHYPALVITGVPYPRWGWSRAPVGAFKVHRGELLRHLARAGSSTDRFDHPLALARSGFAVDIIRPERCIDSVRYEIHSNSWDLENDHEKDDFADLALLRDDDKCHNRHGYSSHPNTGPLSTSTLGSTLQLARTILASLTNLNNLSLTGYLVRAVPGTQNLPTLRRLTLGPLPPCWAGPQAPDIPAGLRELRICGGVLTPQGIERISTQWDNLRVLEWSVAEVVNPDLRISQTINALLSSSTASPADIEETSAREHRHPLAGVKEQELAPSPHNAATSDLEDSPLIKVRLSDLELAKMLETAPSLGIAEAWVTGWRLPNTPRRLQLAPKPVKAWLAAPPLEDSASEVWEELYDEGKRWWRGEDDA